jgi:hypothetical protein
MAFARRAKPMSLNVLGLDPGPEQTAFAWFDGTRPGLNGIVSNEEMLALLAQAQTNRANIFCEDIASYGMAVGASRVLNLHLDRSLLAAVRRSCPIQSRLSS